MRVPILLYHWFESPRLGAGRSPEFGMKPADFRRQVDWLARGGANVVSLERVVDAVRAARPLPRRPLAITFDDGYADFAEHALPVLAERGLPATMFVVSGLVGKTNAWDRARGEPERRLLDWPELRQIAGHGVEVGSHSASHPDLRALPDRALAAELEGSRKALEDGLGQAVRHLAYPHGLHDARVREAARKAGYAAACAVLLRPTDWLRSDHLALMRAIVHATKGFHNFRLRVRLAAPHHRLAAPPLAERALTA